MSERWRAASRELPLLLWVWCAMVLGLGVARLAALAALSEGSASLAEVLTMAWRGFAFDSRSATAWIAPAGVVTALGMVLPRPAMLRAVHVIRRAVLVAFCGLTPLLTWLVVDYYREFSRPLGHHLFNFFTDDQHAVLQVLINEYDLLLKVPVALIIGALAAGSLLWSERLRAWTRAALWLERRGTRARWLMAAALVLFTVAAARGSLGHRPATRKWSAVTPHPLLNHLVLNPYHQLRYALRDQERLSGAGKLATYLPEGDLRAAAARLGADARHPTLVDAFTRVARGSASPPRHVFLVQLESMDLWPLHERYASFNLVPSLQRLAREGVLFNRFLPSGDTTIDSIASTLLGLADPEIFTARQESVRAPLASALPAQMVRLGYRARGFYGGLLSWQDVGRLWLAQGMHEVYGAADLPASATRTGWGAKDAEVYAHILRTVDPAQPSFTMVVTLSYHPPFDLDLAAEGIAVRPELDALLSDRLGRRELGHLLYMDRELGRFVNAVESRFPEALVVVMGDHRSRRFPKGLQDPWLTRAVPLVLWGHGVHGPEVRNTGGSHLDLARTLIERVAPAGFTYVAMGDDLMHPRDEWGVGHHAVIGPREIYSVEPGAPPPPRLYGDVHAVAWWWITRGPELP